MYCAQSNMTDPNGLLKASGLLCQQLPVIIGLWGTFESGFSIHEGVRMIRYAKSRQTLVYLEAYLKGLKQCLCAGFTWPSFSSGRATAVASVGSFQKLQPMPANSKTDPVLAKGKAI